ncbi:MAG: RodZ domain-containing protein [Sporolactobacillus sp.]
MSELGQALREAREQKGLSLDDLQEETKIQKRYLQAIEAGNFEQLPGEFYRRAFIRNYAETLGLDFAALIDQYGSELPTSTSHETASEIHTMPPEGGEPDMQRVRRARPAAVPKNWSSILNKAIIAVIILIVLMIIYILISHVMGGSTAGQPSHQNAGTSVSFKGSSTKKSTSSRTSSSSSASSDSTSTATQQLKLDKTQGNHFTYTLSGTTKFNVTVATKTGQNAWFMATDATTGKQIVQGMMSASGKKSYHFDASDMQSVQIQFGNVPNSTMKINGKTFKFPGTATVQFIVINFNK